MGDNENLKTILTQRFRISKDGQWVETLDSNSDVRELIPVNSVAYIEKPDRYNYGSASIHVYKEKPR